MLAIFTFQHSLALPLLLDGINICPTTLLDKTRSASATTNQQAKPN